jgi:hypothetical protein
VGQTARRSCESHEADRRQTLHGEGDEDNRDDHVRRVGLGAARLQTLDRGAPVSTYTVARELGHESEAMVRRVYAHLGEIRHRSEVVEYRVEQHLERLGDRLQRLGLMGSSVTGKVTEAEETAGTEKPRDSATVCGAESSDSWAWVELNYRPHAYQAIRSGFHRRHFAVSELSVSCYRIST